jgi:hypothetical protein
MIETYAISSAAFDANKLAKTLPNLKNWEQREDAAEYSHKLRDKQVSGNCNAIRVLFE